MSRLLNAACVGLALLVTVSACGDQAASRAKRPPGASAVTINVPGDARSIQAAVNVYSGPRVLGDGRVIEAGRQRLNYWIAHDGFLRRVVVLAGPEPITIDLTNLGPQQLSMPAGLAW